MSGASHTPLVAELRAINRNYDLARGIHFTVGQAADTITELLLALERCQNFIANTESEMGEPLECGEVARAAIAKARGEAQ